jgi:hypothetical protein
LNLSRIEFHNHPYKIQGVEVNLGGPVVARLVHPQIERDMWNDENEGGGGGGLLRSPLCQGREDLAAAAS